MERCKAGRRQRQEPERELRKDRTRGGQPGHPGAGLSRDPDPDERKSAEKGASGGYVRASCAALATVSYPGRIERRSGRVRVGLVAGERPASVLVRYLA